jgi:hypothetical protein
MSYTSSEVIAMIAAIGGVITLIGTVIVNIIGILRIEKKTDAAAVTNKVQLEETRVLRGQVQEVHTMTNSNLSAVTAKLEQATAEIASLRETIQDLKSERAAKNVSTALDTPAPDRTKESVQKLKGQ